MFGGRPRSFRSLLAGNLEGIATNILADRLHRMVANGLLVRAGDEGHKQRVIYRLTAKSIELVPLMAVLGSWGMRHSTASDALSVRSRLLELGGPEIWIEFMNELGHIHLGLPKPKSSPLEQMQASIESAQA
jgi:DNA-binding HxlR family transcriptional regulator